jgi:hypothetical protein
LYVGEQLSLDITGPIEFETEKYFLLIVICQLSWYVWYNYSYNYPNTERMSEFVRSIQEDLQEKTRVILTDRPPCFSGKKWKQLMSRQGIKCRQAATLHPEGNGLVESNRELCTKVAMQGKRGGGELGKSDTRNSLGNEQHTHIFDRQNTGRYQKWENRFRGNKE